MAKAKEWLTASDRLDPYNWRNTRRENPNDFEQRQTPAKWAAILTAVVNYQNKHNGMSPTDLMISQDTGLSAGQVQYHLREMEKDGLVHDSRGWPRILTVDNATKVQALTHIEKRISEKVKEVTIMDTPQVPAKTGYRSGAGMIGPTGRQDFMVRARAIAQAITDHYDKYGISPKIGWISDQVYGPEVKGTGGAARVIHKMIDLGWLHHTAKRHQDYAVTGTGRAALFGQVADQLHTDMRVNPSVARAPQQPPQQYVPPRPTIPRQPAFEVRRATTPIAPPPVAAPPPPPPAPMATTPLEAHQDVDLVIELTRRGFKVSR